MVHKIGKPFKGRQPIKGPTQQDLDKAAMEVDPLKCPRCTGVLYRPASRMRIISHLRFGTPGPIVYEEHVQVCLECHHVFNLKEQLDADLEDKGR